MRAIAILLLATVLLARAESSSAFVRVSPRDPRYFEYSDGRPYIPNGLNLIHPNTGDADGMARMALWLHRLHTNGGNYARIWLSSPFWDIERDRAGVFDEARAKRLDELLALAQQNGIHLKLTLEHFREMEENPRQRWANKPLHLVQNGGAATNMADFFSGAASRDKFRKKLAWYARRVGSNPTVFGWELWNEVNAVRAGPDVFMPWTETMLAELHRLFPSNLAMQSLGSFDTARVRDLYRRHTLLPGNDVAQVHRYLDLGASLEVCQGPVDVLAADAVRELLAASPGKPVILAESGAVEPKHSGPFKLYAADTNGIILHDVLFAPFFAGAAGAGQIWHWDQYVDRNNLWHHFARFAEVVKDLDPPAEAFKAFELKHDRLRIYVLRGRRTTLAWLRDAGNTWRSELSEGRQPVQIEGIKLAVAEFGDANISKLRYYNPWTNHWSKLDSINGTISLPAFTRSALLRLQP